MLTNALSSETLGATQHALEQDAPAACREAQPPKVKRRTRLLQRTGSAGGAVEDRLSARAGPFRFVRIAFVFLAALPCAPATSAASDEAAVAAGPSFDLTLAEAIALAMRNNRRLINGRLSRAGERFALRVAQDEFKPDFRIGSFRRFETEEGGWARDDTGVTLEAMLRVPTGGRLDLVNAVSGDGIDGRGYGNSLTLRFAQPLLKGGGIAVNTASLRIARAVERIGALVFERAIGDVATAVVFAYRDFLQAQRRVEISARSLQRAKDLLVTNRSLIQAGRMAELEILQAEADVAQRELVLVGAENRLDATRLALIDVLDIDSDAIIRLTETLAVGEAHSVGAQSMGTGCAAEPRGVPGSRAEDGEPAAESCAATATRLVALALANRPDYLTALLQFENVEAELLLAKNNRLWDLSTTLSVAVAGTADSLRTGLGEPFGHIPDNDLRVALELSVPIGDLASKQRLFRARSNLTRAHNDLAELRQSIDIAVRNAVRNVDARLRQVGLATRASELAVRKLDAERQKLKLGLTTNFRVIVFEDDLVRAQTSELTATITYLNALSSLDQTLGTTLQTWGLEVERVERADEANAAEPAVLERLDDAENDR